MSSRPGTAQGGGQQQQAQQQAQQQQQAWQRRDLPGSSSSGAGSHKAPIAALAWARIGGKRLATASEDGVVKLWNIEHSVPSRPEKAEHELVHGSKEVVAALAFHPRKDDLLAVAGVNVTKVYDLRSKSSSGAVIAEAAAPDAIAVAWDGREDVLVAQLNNGFTHIDLRRPKRQHKPTVLREGNEVTDIAFIERGKKLLIATRHGIEVRAWPSCEHLTTLSGHSLHHGRDGGVTALAVSANEKLLASGGMDAQIVLWDLPSATPLTAIYRPDEAVRALSLTLDQSMLAYAQQAAPGHAPCIDVVSVPSGKLLHSIPLAYQSEVLAFNPRWPVLAFAEPCLRDSRSKEPDVGKVSIVHFGR